MRWQLALMGFVTAASVLQADINDNVFSGSDPQTYDETPGHEYKQGPFTVRTTFDLMGNSEFTKCPFKGEKFQFNEFDVDGSLVLYYNECKKEGLSLQLGYSQYTLDWNNNPYFDEEHFNMVSVGLGLFTQRAWRWDWKGLVKMNFDPSHLDFQNYVTWDMLVWGRYELATNWGFHAGVLALTGMKIDRVYPIIGLDWTINDKWQVNLIFPINFSVIYKLNCNWTLALASRFWDVRQRVGQCEPLPKAIWEYRDVGAEFGITYNKAGWNFNVHAGYTSGGKLKISDHNRSHGHRLDFKDALM